MSLKNWRQRLAHIGASFLVLLQTFLPVLTFLASNTNSVKAAPPTNFVNETLITNLTEPTSVSFLPDGKMVILERAGRIHIVQSGASVVDPTPFMDLTSVVNTDQGERGLTGFALDPNFATNNYIYLFYTRNSPLRDRVSRFVVSGNTANPTSETVIWEDNQTAPFWHHGGSIAFGNDGKLYISIGDGFDSGTVQSLTSYRGKLLRINADGTIPTDNPFYDGTGPNLDAIWALGLRNPFRFQVDTQSGRIYIGDVGGNDTSQSDEEINIGTAGTNYGWPICEGQGQTPGGGNCTPPTSPGTYQNPMHTYPHAGSDASVTGGFVYRGGNFPAPYKDNYFYGDYVRNWIKGLTLDQNTGLKIGEFNFEPSNGANNGPYGEIVDIKQGPDGAIYYVDIGISWEGGANPGTVRRIKYVSANQPPVITTAQASVTTGSSPLTVNFTGTATDAESEPLTYSWNFGDGNPLSSEQNPTHIYQNNGQYTARLTVSDGTNQTLSNSINIVVGTPPTINSLTVTSPSDVPGGNITFRAGDVISYSASATDPDQTLTAANYSWNIQMIHLSHTHPEAGPITGTNGTFTTPTSGHDLNSEIQFQFVLTVTDSDGLTAQQAVSVLPETVDLLLASVPSGLNLVVDGINRTTPATINTTINFQHSISAPSSQVLNGSTYNFASWSDNGAQTHTITAPTTAQTYTASFQAVPSGPTPILGYALDETSGTVASSTVGNNPLTLVNGPTWSTQGRYAGALNLDGTNDRATGGSITLPGTFTLMGWVFNPSNSPYETVMTVGTNRDVYLNNGILSFYDGTNDRSFGSAMSTNTWHHIAFVSTGTQQRAYVDGVQVGTTVNGALGNYTGNVQLGAWLNGSNYFDFFAGRIDDARIYSSALTQTEIQTAMASAIGTQPPVNTAPTANNQTVTTTVNSQTQITLTATDPESNPLTYSIVSNPTNGTITGTPPNLSYTPNTSYIGPDSFTFRANDGQLNSNTATVNINVNDVSGAGFALDFNGNGTNDIDRVKIPLNNPETPVDVGATDLTIEWWMKANDSDNVAGSCVTGNDGWINGNVIVDRDIFGNGDYGDYGISMFTNGLAFGVNNGTSGSGLCGDIQVDDGAWHHVAVTRRASDGQMSLYVDGILDSQIDGPDGDISYRNNRSSNYANDPFLVLGAEKHDAGSQYPSYNGIIDELRISNLIRYSANFTIPSQAYNPDNNTVLLYHFDEGTGTTVSDSSTISPTNGQINIGGSPIGPNYVASSAPIAAASQNQSPTANDDTAQTDEDTQIVLSVMLNDTDSDGGVLDVTSVSNSTNGTATLNADNTVTFLPAQNFSGQAGFTYTLSDSQGGTDTGNVTITVNSINDAPNAVNDSATTTESTAINISVLANDTDVENNTLVITEVTSAQNGQTTINANTISYTPNAGFVGINTFDYTISDGNGGTDTGTVTVTVTEVNDIPNAFDDTSNTTEDTQTTIDVLVNDSDGDNDPLTVAVTQQPTKGTAVRNANNTITYTPSANTNGTDTFTYSVNDGRGGIDTATVTIDVTPINDAPLANNQSITTSQNTQVAIVLTGSDIDNNPLTYQVITNPTNGSLTGSAPNLTYIPNNGYTGADSFTFRTNDGTANSNTATVTITVQSSYNPFSLSFDGTDFARFTDIPLSQQYTYETWVYRSQDSGSYETFLSDANTSYSQAMFALYIDGGNNDCSGATDQFAYYQSANGNTQCSGVTIQTGQWYHLAVTRDAANTRRMFVNGNLVSTQNNTPNTSNSTGRVNIGRAGDNNSEYFRGIVDAVRISNIARYTASFTPQTTNFGTLPNTVAIYHLDAGTGQTLSDSSGNNRNGTRGSSSSTETTDPTWVTQSPIISN